MRRKRINSFNLYFDPRAASFARSFSVADVDAADGGIDLGSVEGACATYGGPLCSATKPLDAGLASTLFAPDISIRVDNGAVDRAAIDGRAVLGVATFIAGGTTAAVAGACTGGGAGLLACGAAAAIGAAFCKTKYRPPPAMATAARTHQARPISPMTSYVGALHSATSKVGQRRIRTFSRETCERIYLIGVKNAQLSGPYGV